MPASVSPLLGYATHLVSINIDSLGTPLILHRRCVVPGQASHAQALET